MMVIPCVRYSLVGSLKKANTNPRERVSQYLAPRMLVKTISEYHLFFLIHVLTIYQ